MTTTNTKPHVAFLGLGIMGAGMARRILTAGFPLTVFNRTRDKSTTLEKEGARVAVSPRAAASGAAAIVSMVADDIASRSTWLGDQGALAGAAPGTLLIESSTLTVGWVKELAIAAQAGGCELLDAPVTGSKTQAAEGELKFIVGGLSATMEKARPILSAMGRNVIYVGPTGSGALLKLINNSLCGVQVAAFAEALTLIEKSGLDRSQAIEFLNNGAPGSPLQKTVSARMCAGEFTPNFKLKLMAKDLAYSTIEGHRHSLPLETFAVAREIFKRAATKGYGDNDFSAIIEWLRARQASPGTH